MKICFFCIKLKPFFFTLEFYTKSWPKKVLYKPGRNLQQTFDNSEHNLKPLFKFRFYLNYVVV